MIFSGHSNTKGSFGFTLVELLVTLTIIGLLITLLLPAIQSAREVARNATCQNNLKQVGLALAGYEESRRNLPTGASHQRASGSFFPTFGPSWWVLLLPYLEQSEIHSQFDFDGAHNGWVLLNPRNGQLIDGVRIDAMICPSSPLDTLMNVGSFQVMMPSYVGVSGATSDESFPESRQNRCCFPLMDGLTSSGGVLISNRQVNLKEVTDGLSHTIVVGEASDVTYNSYGNAIRIDGGFRSGWILGTTTVGTPPKQLAPTPSWNIVSVRYPVNSREYELPGVNSDHGPNNPFVSAHVNGVNCLFLDGGVRFLSTDTSISALKSLATRDDGKVVDGARASL